MSKLNSKLYKNKMSEENKKSSEDLNIMYCEQIQVCDYKSFKLINCAFII